MQEYFSLLIESAPDRPVLQFNRCDFRLHWLSAYFPTATIIHLHREPREQWISTFLTEEPVSQTATMANFLPHDEFYLVQWTRDLRRWLPILRKVDAWHPYEVPYLIWRLSEIYAGNYADLSISYEDLIHQPAQTLGEIESVAQCDGLVNNELIE